MAGAAAEKQKQAEDEKDARIAALEAELEAARAAAEQPAPTEGGMAAVLERMTDVMEQLATARATPAGGEHTFGRGETAEQILRSLQGTVSVGEHSGRYTDGSVDGWTDDAELAVPVTFRSKGSNFNVIRKSRTRLVHIDGTPEITPGVHYGFAPAGMFSTDDRDVVEYLRSRPTYNVEFWEVGNEPDREPDVDPVLTEIAAATARLDDGVLARIQAEELEGGKREVVLKAVSVARRTVRGLLESEDEKS